MKRKSAKIIFNKQWPSHAFSEDQRLKIDFLTWEEPNNGRFIWKVDVYLDGKLLNEQVFPTGWNYINERFEKLDLESDDHKCYYVPSEKNGVLIQMKGCFQIPYKRIGYGVGPYVGNQFAFGHVLEVNFRQMSLTSLETYETRYFNPSDGDNIFDFDYRSENEVWIKVYDVVDGQRIETEKVISIQRFE